MATRNSSKTANNANKPTGRRTGRPTNIERQARVQSQALQFINLAAASYAAGMTAALGIDGGVQTLGNLPHGLATGSGIAASQGSQSQNAGQSQNASQSATSARVSTLKSKKAPGRKVEADSKMSLTRDFYAENLNAASPLNRADFVRKAATKFGYTKETANTYVSNIEKEGGYKLVRRGGAGAARGRSRNASNAQNSGNQTQTVAATA